jgi:hypothetical protein
MERMMRVKKIKSLILKECRAARLWGVGRHEKILAYATRMGVCLALHSFTDSEREIE